MTPKHTPTTPFTRRTGLLGAGTLGAAMMLSAPSAFAAPSRPAGRPIREGDTAHVAVTAATSWVGPGNNRPGIDDPAMGRPVDLEEWNRRLGTEERGWQVGELETQAVLGSEVIVDEIRGDWAKVLVTHQGTPRDVRGYPGWVHVPQLVVDEGFAGAAAAASEIATVTALTSRLSATPAGVHAGIPVSFNTQLPVLGRTARAVKVAVPGEAKPQYLPSADVVIHAPGTSPAEQTVEAFIATAERFLGLRYLWAGVSAYGFDCSGYTFTVARHHGVTIHRDAGPQRNTSGLPSVEREDLQRGDLVFFYSRPGSQSIRHVGIFLGEDEKGWDTVIHSPNYRRGVEKVSLEEYDYNDEYAGARRLPLAR